MDHAGRVVGQESSVELDDAGGEARREDADAAIVEKVDAGRTPVARRRKTV